MFLRLLNNVVTICVYVVAIPVAACAVVYSLIKWMCKDIAREWRS
jgi:hypothetical protein